LAHGGLEFFKLKFAFAPPAALLHIEISILMPDEAQVIDGQLNPGEREFLTKVILEAPVKPEIVVEVGTWLGGGSTLHFLRALQANGTGHLWGIEAFKEIYEKMIANIRQGAPDAAQRFTPLFGFSTEVLPRWLKELAPEEQIDCVFLDGGDNPMEQVDEFKLLADRVRVGGVLMAHDAHTRKGKWLGPYLAELDNWESSIHDLSIYGLLHARKLRPEPSVASRQAGEKKLRQLRRQPMEAIARYIPSRMCGLILNSMPSKLRKKLTVGKP
jgi:predicted O-methyltransferase YrrM